MIMTSYGRMGCTSFWTAARGSRATARPAGLPTRWRRVPARLRAQDFGGSGSRELRTGSSQAYQYALRRDLSRRSLTPGCVSYDGRESAPDGSSPPSVSSAYRNGPLGAVGRAVGVGAVGHGAMCSASHRRPSAS